MNRHLIRYYSFRIAAGLLFLSSMTVRADITPNSLPSESEYPVAMEEIVVKGKVPEWRKAQTEQEFWRRNRFELLKPEQGRMDWFPRYEKDERDNYQQVRDRKDEKAGIKVFELKF